MKELYEIFQVISAGAVTFGFGILFNIKGKILIYASIAGGMSWLIYLICKNLYLSEELAYFLGSLIIGLYSEITSKKIKTTATTIMIPALIPLAPGGGIYYTMLNLIEKKYMESLNYGIQTLLLAGAMAMGLFTAITFYRVYKKLRNIIVK